MIKTPINKLKIGSIYSDINILFLLSTVMEFLGIEDDTLRFKFLWGTNEYNLIDGEIQFLTADLVDNNFFQLTEEEIKLLDL